MADIFRPVQHDHAHVCPGSASKVIKQDFNKSDDETDIIMNSALTHWAVQLHLINPAAEYFRNADLLVAADCTAFSHGNFHQAFLKNKKLVIL